MKIDWKYIIKWAAIIAAILVIWLLGIKALDSWKDGKAQDREERYQSEIAERDSIIRVQSAIIDTNAVEKERLKAENEELKEFLSETDKRDDSHKNRQDENFIRARNYNDSELTDAFSGWQPR